MVLKSIIGMKVGHFYLCVVKRFLRWTSMLPVARSVSPMPKPKLEPWEVVQSISLVHAYPYGVFNGKNTWICGFPFTQGHDLGWPDITCLRCLDAVVKQKGRQFAGGAPLKRFNELQEKLKTSG
jgi:hypothetical protein